MPALDGLRGLAVLAVLAFHGGMPWARGGFLGVDAFFVLSGYLITSLLLTEWEQSGRIALVSFWGRRARRLLPALLLMLTVVALGARALLPPEELRSLRGDGLAALFYVANWRMILRGSDYFTQTATPSPLEHTWSLGIEEQFYLAWPLLLTCLLAGSRTVTARRAAVRSAILLCAAGAGLSAVLLARRYDSDDPGRAYYGTDTRGASLLVGAGLALLLVRRWRRAEERRGPTVGRRARGALGACSGLAVGGLVWAGSQVGGGDAWLYRGGLLLVAVAVAVLVAHVALVPRGWSATALSVAPLVLLGRISYGVYLWHWPTFLALNADRTGRQGTDLFVLRCLVTLAVSTASYVLVERPVRVGWPQHLPGLARNAVVTGAAVATVGALVVATTAVGARGRNDELLTSGPLVPTEAAGPVDVDDVDGAWGPSAPGRGSDAVPRLPGDAPSARRASDHHPLAGRVPVVVVFGDSVAWTLVRYLPRHPGLDVRGRTLLGCGVARAGPYRYFGQTYPRVGPDCRVWPALWSRAITADDPDVALILVGRWETMDRMLDGRWTHVGDPALDAYLRAELELAIATAGAHGARVVLGTEPYNRRGEQLDGSPFPEDEPARVTAWNDLVHEVAAEHPDVDVLDFGARVSPEGRFSWTAGGIQVRSDGLHLTPSGVQGWIAPWLLPRLRTASARP